MSAIATETLKLNLGSGKYPRLGWTNIDLHETDADIQGDFRRLEFSDVAEISMIHLLEHMSWHETFGVLTLLREWMAPEGKITIEVPDMEEIMRLGTTHPLWMKYVYGEQGHAGECHLSGFTEAMLLQAMRITGWREIEVRRFISDFEGREGMPCLEGIGYA